MHSLPLVQTLQEFQNVLQDALAQDTVALDTEFVWTSTFTPCLGLVQLGWSEDYLYLLDPVVLSDLSPLRKLLEEPKVCKVLHDAQQDLSILYEASGGLPKNVFDTRLAAGFCGFSSTLSLANLLKETLEIDLPKTETRTDWVKRPLSEKQLEYALDDIRHLPALKEHLSALAAAHGNTDRLLEDLENLNRKESYLPRDPEEHYLRIKGAGRLEPKGLAVLQALAAWREGEARRRNVPRGHVLQDKTLLKLAHRFPKDEEALAASGLLSSSALRRYGEDILTLGNRAVESDSKSWPPLFSPEKPSPEIKVQVTEFLSALREACQTQAIDPALVCNRREATACFSSGGYCPAGRLAEGWRSVLVAASMDLPQR